MAPIIPPSAAVKRYQKSGEGRRDIPAAEIERLQIVAIAGKVVLVS